MWHESWNVTFAVPFASICAFERLGDFGQREFARRDLLGQDLRVVLGLEVERDAELFGPLRVVGIPHQPARRAGGDDFFNALRLHRRGVVAQRLFKELPLACHQHRDTAAHLVLAQRGELDARRVQQLHG